MKDDLRMPRELSLRERKHAIAGILEARFSVRAFEGIRRENPAYWASPRNDMGRGIYGQAMREKQRLSSVPDELLLAESAAAKISLEG